jgi:hypothetical protein
MDDREGPLARPHAPCPSVCHSVPSNVPKVQISQPSIQKPSNSPYSSDPELAHVQSSSYFFPFFLPLMPSASVGHVSSPETGHAGHVPTLTSRAHVRGSYRCNENAMPRIRLRMWGSQDQPDANLSTVQREFKRALQRMPSLVSSHTMRSKQRSK